MQRPPLSYRLFHLGRKLLDALDPSDWLDKILFRFERFRAIRAGKSYFRDENAPDEPPVRLTWFRAHWLLSGLLVVLALAVPGVYAGKRLVGHWQKGRWTEKAEASLATRDWEAACASARVALEMQPDNRRAVWVLFRAQRALGAPVAVDLAYWLSLQSDISLEEKYETLAFLSGPHPQGAFLTAYAALAPGHQDEPRFRALYARFLLRCGEVRIADELLKAALTGDAETAPALLLERVRLSCQQATPETLRAARTDFLTLQSAGAPEALEALRLLAAVPDGVLPDPLSGFPLLASWLDSLPGATAEDRLISYDQRWALGEPTDILTREVEAAFGAAHPAEVCQWLTRHGAHDAVIRFASSGAAQETPAGFSAVVRAQISLGLTAVVNVTLTRTPDGLAPAEMALLRLEAAAADPTAPAGEADPLDDAWKAVLRAAAADRQQNRAWQLAAMAEKAGRPADREEALAIAWQHMDGDLPLFRAAGPVMNRLAQRDRLPDVIRILANLGRFEGMNGLLADNIVYLQCLTSTAEPRQVLPALEERLAKDPVDSRLRKRAFLLLIDGRTDAALEALEALERITPGDDPWLMATLGTALHVAGRDADAKRFLDKTTWNAGLLLPAEERWLQRLLAPARQPEPAASGT